MSTFKQFFIYLMAVVVLSCQSDAVKEAERTNVDMAIEGMVCAIGCAKTIEEKISEMTGILSCKVSFEEGGAHITFDRSVLTSLDIQQAIEKMNDGQYKVKILHEAGEKKKVQAEESGSRGGLEDPVSVKEPSFSFPHLLTYFMKNSL